MRLRPTVVGAALLLSCGGEGTPSHPSKPKAPAGECEAGTLVRDDGTCAPAGLPPDAPCEPGQAQRDDGSCVPAGVPPDGCAPGFTSDGEAGCEAVLPAAACPAGQMAVPGETACREIASCGQAPWGDIPVEGDTQYVDAAYAGGGSDGSAAKPWTTIGEGVAAAADGAIVAIALGSYAEDVLIVQKSVRLWGRCPSMVEVVGVGAELAAVGMGMADKSEVHAIGIRGPKGGMGLTATLDAVVDRVWIHDVGGRGLEASSALGPSSISLSGSLLEQSVEVGLFVGGSQAKVDGCAIRSTKPNSAGKIGRGVSVQDSAAAGEIELKGSLIEGNADVGFFVAGATATIDRAVIRDNAPSPAGGGGRGVVAQPGTSAPTTLAMHGCLVDHNNQVGVLVVGSDATIERTVVRQTAVDAGGEHGRGIEVDAKGGAGAKLDLRESMVRDNHEIGIIVGSSSLTLEASVVRDTAPTASGFGVGIQIQTLDPLSPISVALRSSLVTGNHEYALDAYAGSVDIDSSLIGETLPNANGTFGLGILMRAGSELELHGSIVEKAHDIGVLLDSASATVESTVVRDTQPNAAGHFGRGLQAQASAGPPSTLTLRASRIERAFDASLVIVDSSATVEDCAISETHANMSEAAYGDGIVVQTTPTGTGPGSVTITRTRVENSARAAVSSFGGLVTLSSSDLVCQAFDLDGEVFEAAEFTWTDDGKNRCGCPGADRACVALSSQLLPPAPVDAAPGQ